MKRDSFPVAHANPGCGILGAMRFLVAVLAILVVGCDGRSLSPAKCSWSVRSPISETGSSDEAGAWCLVDSDEHGMIAAQVHTASGIELMVDFAPLKTRASVGTFTPDHNRSFLQQFFDGRDTCHLGGSVSVTSSAPVVMDIDGKCDTDPGPVSLRLSVY